MHELRSSLVSTVIRCFDSVHSFESLTSFSHSLKYFKTFDKWLNFLSDLLEITLLSEKIQLETKCFEETQWLTKVAHGVLE